MSTKIPVTIDSELSDLIPGFLENRRKDLLQINTFLETANFLEIKNIGHKLKGNAGGYGFDELSKIGARLEKAATDSNRESVYKAFLEIKNYLDSIEITYE